MHKVRNSNLLLFVLISVVIFFFLNLESPEGFAAALKAYQSLEPGDFTGFLKLLRSPASKRLQTRCTTFLNTMEAYHVGCHSGCFQITLDLSPCASHHCDVSFQQELPVQKQSDYVQDFYQSFAKYFKGEHTLLQVLMYSLS